MLLKEMGTVRNKRNLKDQNDKLAALCKGVPATTILTRYLTCSVLSLPGIIFIRHFFTHQSFLSRSFDEENSLALTESQHSMTVTDDGRERAQPSKWELDPHDRRPSIDTDENAAIIDFGDSGKNDVVFLTGVDGNEDENEEEEVVGGEYLGNNESARLQFDEMSENLKSQSTVSGILPYYTQPGADVLDKTRFSAETVRSIPVPDHMKIPPLHSLRHSVSTLDVVIAKSNYSNIHTNRCVFVSSTALLPFQLL